MPWLVVVHVNIYNRLKKVKVEPKIVDVLNEDTSA